MEMPPLTGWRLDVRGKVWAGPPEFLRPQLDLITQLGPAKILSPSKLTCTGSQG